MRLFEEGKAEGKAEAKAEAKLHELMETKFGPLPKWASERLARANLVQLERWAKKILIAGSLEAVLGKK